LKELLKTGKLSLEQTDQVYFKEACKENAKRFGKEAFKKTLMKFIDTHI